MSYIHLEGEVLLRTKHQETPERVKVVAFVNGQGGRKRTSRFRVRRPNGEEVEVSRRDLRPLRHKA